MPHPHTTGDAGGWLPSATPEALKLRRALRKVFYWRPKTWCLIDEIEAPEPIAIEALFHSDFPFAPEGGSWVARGRRFWLRLTALATAPLNAAAELQACCYVDGTVTRRYPVLKLQAGKQKRCALATLLEVLPAADSLPPPPKMKPTRDGFHLAWQGKNMRVKVFNPDPAQPGCHLIEKRGK